MGPALSSLCCFGSFSLFIFICIKQIPCSVADASISVFVSVVPGGGYSGLSGDGDLPGGGEESGEKA